MTKRVDVGADVQRHDHSVFGKLETTGTLGTCRVITAVTSHEMLQPRAVAWYWRFVREKLCKPHHLASAHQASCALNFLGTNEVKCACFIIGTPATPGIRALVQEAVFAHVLGSLLVGRSVCNLAFCTLPVVVRGNSISVVKWN